jgi:hypothetical protein
MAKSITPVAINALKEALTNIYWYKADLRSFLLDVLSDSSIVYSIDWDTEYKRGIVTKVVTFLSNHEEIFQNDLLRLMSEVVKMDDFHHLESLDDGKAKAKKAKQSVEALKKYFEQHGGLSDKQKEIEERRRNAYEESLKNKAIRDNLEVLKGQYYDLIKETDTHKRGYALEKLAKDIFELFDLDPKASFRIQGEQIDGAFSFEGTDYLFEGKWQKDLIDAAILDAFKGKLSRKLDNTLGLFLSINGYSEDAVKIHSAGRGMMILMDGNDVMAVLEGRIDFVQLLLRKRRCAAQTGNIYLRIHDIL